MRDPSAGARVPGTDPSAPVVVPPAVAAPPRPRARPGYSLVELFLTLVIMAVALAAVTPRVNRAAYDADAAARVVVGTLQVAQRLAVTQQSTVVVGFDTARRRMRVLEDRNGNLQYDPAVTDSERVTWRPVDPPTAVFATPPSGVNGAVAAALASFTTPAATTDGFPSVAFRRDGAASDNVEVYVRVVRGALTEWRAVTVARATGRVTWWSRPTAGGAWKRRSL
ncbi:hypothetical protein tb265_17290 [Gemmatimonadetes bacterium T265]|nr:hypothetical protein tb265_17290 [Gemmatimonadetes bacterium T265]